MSATWCCAHELKQPLALMCRCFAFGSLSMPDARSCLPSSAASDRDDEMPSLHVSVPGQAQMSLIVPAPGAARSIAFNAA